MERNLSNSLTAAFLGMLFLSLLSFDANAQNVIAKDKGNIVFSDRGEGCTSGT